MSCPSCSANQSFGIQGVVVDIVVVILVVGGSTSSVVIVVTVVAGAIDSVVVVVEVVAGGVVVVDVDLDGVVVLEEYAVVPICEVVIIDAVEFTFSIVL